MIKENVKEEILRASESVMLDMAVDDETLTIRTGVFETHINGALWQFQIVATREESEMTDSSSISV